MKKWIYKLLLLDLFLMGMSTTISAQEVGVYMWYGESKPSGNYVDNLRMVRATDGSWTTDRPLLWKNAKDEACVALYTPYDPNISNAEEYQFSVSEDQSTAEALQKADLQYKSCLQVTPSQGRPTTTLRHLLSKVVVKVKAGGNVSEKDLCEAGLQIRLKGVTTVAQVNLLWGSAYENGTRNKTIIPYQKDALTWEAILPPQYFYSDCVLSMTMNNSPLTYSLSDKSIDSGRIYTLTVTVNDLGQGGFNIGIEGWEDNGEDYGGMVN